MEFVIYLILCHFILVIIAIDPLAKLLLNDIKILNQTAQGEFNSIQNAVEYQFGTTISKMANCSNVYIFTKIFLFLFIKRRSWRTNRLATID